MDLGTLAGYLKLPARVYAAAVGVCAALLFAPAPTLKALALDQVAEAHRGWIGFGFVVALALLVVEVVHLGWRAYRERSERRRAAEDAAASADARTRKAQAMTAARLRRLEHLTDDEKDMLRPFVVNNARAWRVPFNNATRHALIAAGIISMESQAVGFDRAFNDLACEVFIQPWALEHLQTHPELLE